MTKHSSDFPEFDQAYRNALIKDPTDPFERLAAEANFNVYHSDIWRGTGRKFAELIVRECAKRLRETDYELMFVEDGMCDPSISDAMLVAASDIEEHFGVKK